MIEILKAAILGLIEGITEWLPISSTGHMILVEQFLTFDMSAAFVTMFRVVIQLGAILAVIVLYWNRLIPFSFRRRFHWKRDTLSMWGKILVAAVPAGIIGLAFDDNIDALFYNPWTVAVTLIVYGILFIVVENANRRRQPHIRSMPDMTYKAALLIGVFQVLSLIPGTSRSGATILGAILIGTSRTVAAEFTFFLAVPVMLGASLVKMLKFGLAFTPLELAVLICGMVVAFLVSVVVIRFLLSFIRKHNFKVFGWYRILLGLILIGYFLLFA